MKQQPHGKPEGILLIAGEVFIILSLHFFPVKLFWSSWPISGDSEDTLQTSGEDKDGQSVQE